jgi:hypothetical protein
MSLLAYDVCRGTLETVNNRADFTITTELAHAFPATPLLAELPTKPFFFTMWLLCNATLIYFLLNYSKQMNEMFTRYRLEVSVFFSGCDISCHTSLDGWKHYIIGKTTSL